MTRLRVRKIGSKALVPSALVHLLPIYALAAVSSSYIVARRRADR